MSRPAVEVADILRVQGDRFLGQYRRSFDFQQLKAFRAMLGTEFLRLFFLHVLPKGFVRMRYFGFLANRFHAHRLPLCQQLLASDRPTPSASSETTSTRHCPTCGAAMIVIHRLTAVELSRCSYFDTS